MITDIVKINENIEDQLLYFETKNIYEKYRQDLCQIFADFVLDLREKDIYKAFNNLKIVFKNNLEIKENKIYFKIYDTSKIATLVFERLYEEDRNNTFDNYIKLIEDNIYENSSWYYLDFSIYNEYENIDIKNCFFNEAIRYIEQNKIILQFYKLDDKIQKQSNLDKFYYWLKNSKFDESFKNCFYDNEQIDKIFNLIDTIIKFYDYNTHNIHYRQENPIFKLLNLDNDFVNATLLLSGNIRLNIFFLKHFEHFCVGFINLVEFLTRKCDENYFKFLIDELTKILFKHFYRSCKKSEFSGKIFIILNILVASYFQNFVYKNKHIFYYQYLIDKIFNFLELVEINSSAYEKIFLFNFIFNDLIKLQIEDNDIKSYFLLSRYIELAKKLNIEIDDSLIENILSKIKNLLNEDDLQFNSQVIEGIDFSVFYNGKYKNLWLNLLKIEKKKQTWKEIQTERKRKRTIGSNDRQEPKKQIKLYFKILSDIFVKTLDKDIQEKIIKLAKYFGLDVNYGIFEDFIFDRDFFYEKFLKILNLFDDNYFDIFLYELKARSEIFKIIKLYSYTYSTKRKEKISIAINQLENFNFDIWKKFNYSKSNMIEGIELLISNQSFVLANKLLNFINFENKELNYLKCEKEILDVYFYNKNFDELNQIKYIEDDRNRGIESLYNKCEEYKTLIRALIFFDKEPKKTSIIIESEISKTKFYKKLYFVNLINAYLKIFMQDDNNFNRIKLLNSIKSYEGFLENSRLNKDLFDYKTLLFSYIELNNYVKSALIIDKLPEYYLRDFEMIILKYNFLKKFKSEIKAAEFLDKSKQFMTDKEIKIIEKEKLDDLFEYRKEIRERLSKTLEYQFAISFAGEYRDYMTILSDKLRKLGYRVFLDNIYESQMLGEDLVEYLTNIFKNKSEFVVIFVSNEYKNKFYTNEIERKAIINREYFQDCIIQLKYDDTKLNKISDNYFYIDLSDSSINEINWEEIALKLKEKYESLGE